MLRNGGITITDYITIITKVRNDFKEIIIKDCYICRHKCKKLLSNSFLLVRSPNKKPFSNQMLRMQIVHNNSILLIRRSFFGIRQEFDTSMSEDKLRSLIYENMH